jgi:hypothetical protein
MFSGLLTPVYLLDACCLVELDGRHRDPPASPSYTVKERALIWRGLESLARDGRLKLIRQVKRELKRWHPDGLKKLAIHPGTMVFMRRTPPIVRRYQTITSTYPQLVKGGSLIEKADPWLILVAQLHGYTIVTEELPQDMRKRKKNEIHIPDACLIESILCINLRRLAKDEKWL